MEKKERIFIVLATSLILLSIFVAFIISNSQKVPPEVLVQNEEQKIVSAIMGGYTWKVFGTNHITLVSRCVKSGCKYSNCPFAKLLFAWEIREDPCLF